MISNVSGALRGWMALRKYKIVTTEIINYRQVETEVEKVANMMIQPLPQQIVDKKPEGQRDWKYWTIWSNAEFNLNDIIIVNNKRYKIKSKQDWGEAKYYQYETIEDYEKAEEIGS
jgi:hypothetical protein